jgi:hypothetical protein
MVHTFRTQPKHWVSQIVGAVLSLGVFVLGIEYLLPGWGTRIGLALWLLLMYILTITELLPMWRICVTVDKNGLFARTNDGFYEMFWIEIVAANLFEQVAVIGFSFRMTNRARYLWIATRKYTFQIPMRYLDAEQVWCQVQAHLSPEIAGDVAYTNWLEKQEWYQEWNQSQAALIQAIDAPLRTRQKGWLMALGWIGVAFFAGFAVFSALLTGSFNCASFLFFVFAVLSASLVLPDVVEIDDEKVTRITTFLGCHQIRWDEVERIEHDGSFTQLVFYGKDKRLPIFGPKWWASSRAQEMSALLRAQVQQRGIEVRFNPESVFVALPKNTRARSRNTN